ncbi:hypothetical protein CVIRNUC_010751 [Coccomyxa viridis]|uniref:Uncharacterized protein n=1 Tax=Coccomyxa viridis TaxID=1274662 RepID=A0AAV1IJM8_9CHLO|nr:hypothetical protein CVIRNUC_010751 [Coccomyxa viridis]
MKLVPDLLRSLYILSSSVTVLLCQPLVRVLSVPYELLVPDHTRDALFQLACDLRANPIKDKHWVLVHWRRLKPRTFPGWIAMGWALLFVASAGTGAAGLLLCVVMGVMYTLGFILASAGMVSSLVVGMLLTCVAFWCFLAACVTGFMCAGAGFAYCGTSTLWTVIGFLGDKLNSHHPQEVPLKPPPTLAPVATPRAASPSSKPAPMPVAPEKEAALRSTLGQPNALPAIDPGSPRFAGVAPAPTGLACGHVSTSQEMTNPVLEDAELEAGIAEQVANAKAILEDTAKPSTPLDALSPLPQPMGVSEDSALSDSTSANSSTAMLGKGPEAARVPNGTGMASSKFTNGNGMPKQAKQHKMQGGKAHVQRQVSPPR